MKTDLFRIWTQREAELGRRLPLHEVSDETGISVPTLSRWRNGHVQRFGSKTLRALSRYFDCPISDLLVDDDAE